MQETQEDACLNPGLERHPGVGNGNLLQYSCLENSMDRGAWWATVCGVTKSQAWLSTCTHTHTHTHNNYIYPGYCCSSVSKSCPTLSNSMHCSMPGFLVPPHLLGFAQVHVHWIGDAIQTSHPLSSSAFSLSQLRVFSNESVVCIRWPKYWSFWFSISPSSEYSGLIFFKTGLVWTVCCPRDSQESSLAPQLESINSLDINKLR